MWRSRGMERGREVRKICKKGVVVWVTAHLDLEEWECVSVCWGGGDARRTQSAAYTTVPAGKRRYFCLCLNPYTACCSDTTFMFTAFHWTQLTFKGYAWSIERSKVDHGYTRERYSGGGTDQMICCVWEDQTEPSCGQKQVWLKRRSSSKCQVKIWYNKNT